jgi:acyl carrier protein
VTLDYVEGPRNGPALRFLVELTRVELFGDGAASVATETARAMAFDCERASFSPTADEEGPKRPAQASSLDRGAAYEWIASECLSGAAILSAMSPSRPRPPISAGFSAPAPGLQSEIARIWEEALGIAPVGVNDPIKDLGGASLHLVRIHGLLADRLGVEIDLAHLFRFATVAELAAHLNDVSIDRVAAAAGRAAKMRGARLQAAARAARAAPRLEGRAS